MCGHGEHQNRHGHDGCCCGPADCGPGHHFGRRFATRAERIARLEEYLGELRAEVQAVEEAIAELKVAG